MDPITGLRKPVAHKESGVWMYQKSADVHVPVYQACKHIPDGVYTGTPLSFKTAVHISLASGTPVPTAPTAKHVHAGHPAAAATAAPGAFLSSLPVHLQSGAPMHGAISLAGPVQPLGSSCACHLCLQAATSTYAALTQRRASEHRSAVRALLTPQPMGMVLAPGESVIK
jgi:hypothetical protein